MQISLKNNLTNLTSTGEIFAAILKGRGFSTKKAMEEFLRPPAPTLAYLLENISVSKKELVKTKKMFLSAIKEGQDICVFGDYDADGITSTAILWQSLMLLAKGSKARIMPFIPDRGRHGYGLSHKAVTDILDGTAFVNTAHPDFRPSLIITVDNGIVANEVVKELKDKGLKVIITDHHQPGSELPACDALVHSINTSGAGISWLTSLYCTDEKEAVAELIDLAAIGIVADQIPLVGVNRSIVTAGLKKLMKTNSSGLKSMLELAGITGKTLSTYDINYIIAPRINAVGRLDNPLDALRLLCSRDSKVTQTLAMTIEKHNLNRQELTDQSIKSALKEASSHKIVVSSSTDYHEGIIGLVAGKLAESHNRPAVVISVGKEVSKGSARSIGSINITNILRAHKDLLLGVGGHELAAGFSLESKNIPEFTQKLYAYADKHIKDEELEKKMIVEGELKLSQITKSLAKFILTLEPFGMGNYKPRFLIKDVNVLEDRVIGKNGNHRKLVIEQDGVTRDVIWFNGEAKHPLHSIKEMVATAEINVWRDRESVQLNAQYVQPN